MEYLNDLRFWFLVIVAGVWLTRARRALQTIRTAPFIRPGSIQNVPSKIKISVIIPARNEEKNIAICLESLLQQDYPDYEIIVINDNSTDRTGSILASYKERIKVVNASPTPEGWTGKNHAIRCGLPAATGTWFLFTDADTVHERTSLSSAFSHAWSRDLSLLTLTPRCLSQTFMEHLIQPAAMALMGLWFPIEKINRPGSRVVFGNGQYLMMEKKFYEKINGHAGVRSEFLEDFALVRAAKKMKGRVECAIGTDVYGTRMYQSFGGIWNGWRRIFLHSFESRLLPLLMHFANLILFSVMPFTVFLALCQSNATTRTHGFVLGMAAAICIFILGTVWTGYSILRSRKIFSLLYPAAGLLIAMILLDAAWMAGSGKKTVWR